MFISGQRISNVIDPQIPYTTPRYANPGGLAKHLAVSQHSLHRMRSHRGLAHKLADDIRLKRSTMAFDPVACSTK
jgi:hypothetical protein